MTQQLIPIYEGFKQVGWKHPDTGVYTPAVRVEPSGQPIGSLPKPLSQYWGDWP